MEDKAKLADMVEKFRYFLSKYEGFGFVMSTCHFWENGEMKTQNRFEFLKMFPSSEKQVTRIY